jgi:1,4-alpha-glucan branching enzyme
MTELTEEAYAIVEGRHSGPFHYLGRHSQDGKTVMRAFLPGASSVDVFDEHRALARLELIHPAGLFEGLLPTAPHRYQLRVRFREDVVDLDDPYRFEAILTDLDLIFLLKERISVYMTRSARISGPSMECQV